MEPEPSAHSPVQPTEQLRNIISSDEEIKWVGRPNKKAWYWGSAIGIVPMIVFFTIFFGIWGIGLGLLFYSFLKGIFGPAVAIAIPAIGAVVALACFVGSFIFSTIWSYKHAEYAATDERLIEFSGVIGRDFSTVKWDKVQDLEVDVNMADKWFDTGKITLHVAGTANGISFDYVNDPYDVLGKLQEVQN